MHKHASTLRYILETLIITKLLISENDYFVKIYFSIYKQQKSKTKTMINRIENELERLNEYHLDYLAQIEENRRKYSTNVLTLLDEDEKTFQSFKDLMQKDINICFSQLEELGFEFLIHGLKNTTLKAYQDRLKRLKRLKKNKAKELARKQWFKDYFGQRVQHTQVFHLLRDMRTWREKAKCVDLEKEYDLNYVTTSSLLHFTSYSLLTSNISNDNEINYNYMIINKYIKQITTNISAFQKL